MLITLFILAELGRTCNCQIIVSLSALHFQMKSQNGNKFSCCRFTEKMVTGDMISQFPVPLVPADRNDGTDRPFYIGSRCVEVFPDVRIEPFGHKEEILFVAEDQFYSIDQIIISSIYRTDAKTTN